MSENNGDAAENRKTGMKMAKKPLILKLLGLFVIAVMLAITAVGILLAFKDFKPRSGILGSDWVGIKHIERFLYSANALVISRNTVLMRLLQIAFGFTLALPLGLWIKASKNPGRALTKACVCLIPACLPFVTTVWVILRLAPHEMLVSPSYYRLIYPIATVLQTAGLIAFCAGLFEYLGRQGIGSGIRTGLLLGILIMSLTLLTEEIESSYLLQNNMNLAVSESLDTYIIKTGLINYQFSFSSAVWLVKTFAQTLLAVLPAMLIARMTRIDDLRIVQSKAKSSAFTVLFAVAVWAVIIFAVAVYVYGVDELQQDPEGSIQAFITLTEKTSIVQSSTVSMVVSVAGGALAGVLMLGLINLLRSKRKAFAPALILMTMITSFSMAEYLLVMNMGILNTHFALIFRLLLSPRLILITIILCTALRMAPERGTRSIGAGIGFLGASIGWGSWLGTFLYGTRTDMFTLAWFLRNLMLGVNINVQEGEQMTKEIMLAQQAAQPISVLLVTLPALLLAACGAVCLAKAFKKAY